MSHDMMISSPAVYECPDCGERQAGVRRCQDCNLFMRRLGPGGSCPHCDEPVLVAELLGVPGDPR